MLSVFEHGVLREYVDLRETGKEKERESNTSTEKIT